MKAAVLEVLAESPPGGAPHWRLADLTGRVGASRRALEEGIAVAPASRGSWRTRAMPGRFWSVSRHLGRLRVCFFCAEATVPARSSVDHADAAPHAPSRCAARGGTRPTRRARPWPVGDRARFKPRRSLGPQGRARGTAIHRGGEKVSVREEATDEVHRLPATAVKRAASRSPRSSAAPDVSRPRASKVSGEAPAPRRLEEEDAPAPAPTTRAPGARRNSRTRRRRGPPRAPRRRAAEQRGPPGSPRRGTDVPTAEGPGTEPRPRRHRLRRRRSPSGRRSRCAPARRRRGRCRCRPRAREPAGCRPRRPSRSGVRKRRGDAAAALRRLRDRSRAGDGREGGRAARRVRCEHNQFTETRSSEARPSDGARAARACRRCSRRWPRRGRRPPASTCSPSRERYRRRPQRLAPLAEGLQVDISDRVVLRQEPLRRNAPGAVREREDHDLCGNQNFTVRSC